MARRTKDCLYQKFEDKEYVLPIESDMVSFPRPIPHTSAVPLGSNLIFSNTKFKMIYPYFHIPPPPQKKKKKKKKKASVSIP